MAPDDVIAESHGFSDPDAEPMPWSAGREQVIAADTLWLSTVRPDGRPHVTPLIAGLARRGDLVLNRAGGAQSEKPRRESELRLDDGAK